MMHFEVECVALLLSNMLLIVRQCTRMDVTLRVYAKEKHKR